MGSLRQPFRWSVYSGICGQFTPFFPITTDPISFIKEAIKDEMIQFDIEKENMVDKNFEDTEFTLYLNWNISPDFEY